MAREDGSRAGGADPEEPRSGAEAAAAAGDPATAGGTPAARLTEREPGAGERPPGGERRVGRRADQPSRRSAAAVVLRFVGSVLAVSGVLLLADAAATVAWQEPVSALIGSLRQDALEDDFAALTERVGAAERPFRPAAEARRLLREVDRGDALGRVVLPTLDRDYVFVEGTGTAELRKGPGHYEETGLPGQGRTVGIAGHRTTWLAPFRTIDDLDRGDAIVVEMPYGRFTYVVERSRIVDPTEVEVIGDTRAERLVLTACHPLYSAAQRIAVTARLERAEPLAAYPSSAPTALSSRDSSQRISATTSASEIARTAVQ